MLLDELLQLLAIKVVQLQGDEGAYSHVADRLQQREELPGALQDVERTLYRTERGGRVFSELELQIISAFEFLSTSCYLPVGSC